MAGVWYGVHPNLFVMTTNPQWREIVENLLPGQTASMRPDLVVRVSAGKLKELLKDLNEHQIYIRVVAKVHVIEFQTPGLPHTHILISFAQKQKLKFDLAASKARLMLTL